MKPSAALESAPREHPGLMALALSALLLAPIPAAQAMRLNDTGQIVCYNASASTGTVSPGTPGPVDPGFEGQDCTRGAAAADALGAMTKQGASSTAGRDYTKISNVGEDLPASATLGPGDNDWACTRDNVTGLVWEVKVDNPTHLRHVFHLYTWYDTDGTLNGGHAGNVGMDMCEGTLPSGQCNSSAYRDAVNAGSLCGATDWRLPTLTELSGLVDYGAGTPPLIDTTYFPDTPVFSYWTTVTFAWDAYFAWTFSFSHAQPYASLKIADGGIRLVRGGQ